MANVTANDTGADVIERPRSHRENRKKNRGRKVEDNQAQAIAKFIRVQPRKARLVIDEIRGRYAEEALHFLRFIPNRAAGYISKVLSSAMANAENNHGLTVQNLKLIEARVDEGPRMKRVQPRAQGRAYRILKRTSHITIIVQEVEPRPRKPKKPTGSRAQAARAAKQPTAARPTPVPAEETKPTAAVAEETAVAAPQATEPIATATPPAAETSPAEMQAPEPVAETATTTTAEQAEASAPEAAAPQSAEVSPAAEADQGPQEANAGDTTDEIGAPIDTDADKA
jgi:large subunit ribosomal protein L22